MAGKWNLASKKHPCLVCSGTTNKCKTSLDGSLLLCMNSVESPAGFKAIEPTSNGLWNQFVKEKADSEPKQKRSATPRKPMQVISADERDRLYRKLFGRLSLIDVDRADLERRGFTPEQIDLFGAASVGQWQLVGSGFDGLPGVLPGGSLNTQPGLLIPVRDVDGRIVGCQMRLREPGDCGRYRWLSSSTRKNPDGATPHVNGELPLAIYRPVEVWDSTIGLCEGTGHKPCLAAHRLGQIVVGAAGGLFDSSSNTLKRTLSKLSQETGSKTVVFYPDAGSTSNLQVLKTMRATFDAIRKLGYELKVAWWGQEEKGTHPDIDELTDVSKINLLSLPVFLEIAGQDAAEFFNREENKRGSKLAGNIRRFSELLGDRLKLNEMTGFYEFDGKQTTVEELEVILAMDFDIDVPRNFDKIVLPVAQKYHPVLQYLESSYLKYGQTVDPDAVFGNFAERYFGCPDKIYQDMMRKWFIGTVRRVFEPGCQRDEVLILQGKQGYRKSSFLRVISNGWFDDSVGALTEKDEKLKLHRSWLIEWPEIEGVFRKKDVSIVKAQITCQTDLVRPPYGRSVVEMRRFSTICGTTNEAQFLADPTGNRRYQVMPVLKKIDTDLLEQERDQIWAAAVVLYMQGEQHWFDDDMQSEVNRLTAQYENSHPWEFSVLSYISDRSQVTIREILQKVIGKDLKDQTRADEMIVCDILRRAGWEQGKRQTVNGVRIRPWVRSEDFPMPEDAATTEPTEELSQAIENQDAAPQTPIVDTTWPPSIGQRVLAYFDGEWRPGSVSGVPDLEGKCTTWTVHLDSGAFVRIPTIDRIHDPSIAVTQGC